MADLIRASEQARRDYMYEVRQLRDAAQWLKENLERTVAKCDQILLGGEAILNSLGEAQGASDVNRLSATVAEKKAAMQTLLALREDRA